MNISDPKDDLTAIPSDVLHAPLAATSIEPTTCGVLPEEISQTVAELRAARQAIARCAAQLRQCEAVRKDAQELADTIRQALDELPQRVSDAITAAIASKISDLGVAAPCMRRRKAASASANGTALPLTIGKARLEVRLPRQLGSRDASSNGAGMPRKRRTKAMDYQSHQAGAPVFAEAEDDSAPRTSTLISVIMTTFNSGDFVEQAALNILGQSHQELELIIIDDASTDDTWTLLSRLAQGDSRVRPVKMYSNRGTYWCKNFGLTLARGRYVTFQDSDDSSDPHRLALQLRELRATRAAACTCNYVRIDARGVVVSNRGLSERKAIMAIMIDRQEITRHAGYFDSVRTSADDEFNRRLGIVFGHERICHIDQPLYMAAVRDGSLTNDRRNRAEITGDDESGTDQSFLSAPRREYVRQYSAWHARLKSGEDSPFMPFPLLRRRFPAPSVILPEAGRRDGFVTVSMASIPAREALLKHTVASILPQTDVLNIYLNGYAVTPAWLDDDRINVIHSREYGDLRDNGKFFFLDALLPGYHFTIDDDILYPPDYVQKLVLKVDQYDRQAIVGCHGVVFPTPLAHFMSGREVLHFKRALARDRLVNLLGTGTTAYHVEALDLCLDDFKAPGMADLWLAIVAKRQGVPMIAIERPEGWLKPLDEADQSSLYCAAMRDCQLQTEVAQREGPWDLDELCWRYPLIQSLSSRWSVDEVRSNGLDLEPLMQVTDPSLAR